MEIADFIRLGHQEPALRFLIIGGWAVGAHGYTRSTFDVDFIVRQNERDQWFVRLTAGGLKLFSESKTFAQFSQLAGGDGLDLMFVNDATFERMWQASEERLFGESQARVPCLDHLLALKLHALRQALPHRTSKDADDVEVFVRRNQLNLRNPRYEKLFLKIAAEKCTTPSFASCEIRDAARPSLDLNLPDGGGFAPLPPVVSLSDMIRRNRQLRAWFPGGIRTDAERWRAKSTEEFCL